MATLESALDNTINTLPSIQPLAYVRRDSSGDFILVDHMGAPLEYTESRCLIDKLSSQIADIAKFYSKRESDYWNAKVEQWYAENTYRHLCDKPISKQCPGFVYLIEDINFAIYKIGLSIHPQQRLKQILPPWYLEPEKNRDALCLVATIPTNNMGKLERELHIKYHHKRHKGEWFLLDEEDVEYIQSLAGGAK